MDFPNLYHSSSRTVRRLLAMMIPAIVFSLARGFAAQASFRPGIIATSRTRRHFASPSSLDSSNCVDGPSYSLRLSIPTFEEMEEIGAVISVLSNPPDVIFLDGDLGAGKTTFARGFVRCKLGLDEQDDASFRVTSPTYLLSNTYAYTSSDDESLQEIHHMDLYRLSGTTPNDFAPLHLDHVFKKCISLIEWPSRLALHPDLMPPRTNRLDIDLSIVPSKDERIMTLTTSIKSTWTERLEHLVEEGILEDLILEEVQADGND